MSTVAATPSRTVPAGFVRRLILRGGPLWAAGAYLADQAVCSAGNFVTSFLAARNFPADQFGTFALLNILLVFSLTVNNWLIRSSLNRTLQSTDDHHVKSYTSTLAGLAGLFGLIPAAVLIIASFLLHHPELGPALCLTAVATQVQETMRRSAMAVSKYKVAVFGDSLSYLGQALILGGLALTHSLSLSRLFWVMGATSALSMIVVAKGLGLRRPSAFLATAQRCWEQGRWIVLSGLILSPIVYGMPWIVELTRGEAQAGMLSGLILVFGLSNPIMFSSTWLILARGQAARGTTLADLFRRILPPLSLTALPLVLAWGFVFCFPKTVLHLFYGTRVPYVSLSGSLRLVTIYYVASYAAVCLEVITDVRSKSRDRIPVDVCASLVMLTAGVFASYKLGLVGLLGIGIFTQVARSAAYSWILTSSIADFEPRLGSVSMEPESYQ